MRVRYLNQPDKSDPMNSLRAIHVTVGGRIFKFLWAWPMIETWKEGTNGRDGYDPSLT